MHGLRPGTTAAGIASWFASANHHLSERGLEAEIKRYFLPTWSVSHMQEHIEDI